MKKIIIITLVFALLFVLSRCYLISMQNSPENLQSSAIAIIKAKNINDNKYYYFQLLNNGKILNVKENNTFSNSIEIYNVDSCFESYIDNNRVKNKLISEGSDSTDPDVEKFYNSDIENKHSLLSQIATLEHDLFVVNVFKIKDRVFVNVELNVNLISPSDLYEFKKGKLTHIKSFPDGTEIEQIYSNE
ncbi:MAG: hypothetical protein LIR50_17730 [Bacillota bacterium]|nr:hypothetical protein [Bacillota bacterium]